MFTIALKIVARYQSKRRQQRRSFKERVEAKEVGVADKPHNNQLMSKERLNLHLDNKTSAFSN